MKSSKCRLLLLVMTSIVTLRSTGQTTFVRMYNNGDMGYAVREVNGNSFVVAGSTDYYFNWHWLVSSPIATTNIHLFKTDDIGVMQWERIFSKLNTRLIARWMEPTADGGFIVTGSANSDVTWPPDSNDVILVKTDAMGIIEWSKSFNSGKDDLGFCVQQTTDGGYIISGFNDAMPVSLALNTNIMLIKTDALGTVQWEKKYQFAIRDFNTHEPFSYVVKQTSDGGYIVTGTTAISHPADLNVLRTDAAGNIVWAKTYEHDASMWRNSLGLDIIETLSGDFVIAGSMDKESPLNLNYPYFLKLSSTGNVLKQRFFETLPVLSFQSGLSSVQQTADGGFFFTGMGGYNNFGMQAQLLKTDNNLDMQWSKVYTMDGMATVGSMSGRETTDGGFVFTGKRQLSGSILMKTDVNGMVPCKNPNTLIEYTPSVMVQNWSPVVTSGIISNNVLLTEISPMVDTTIVCPLTVSHLPVELNYFSASAIQSKKVKVDWTTLSELNNDYFIVEKSTDSKTFKETGKLTGAGNSNQLLNYTFTDDQPYPSAISYYRLNQVDFNGANHYSRTVAVKFDKNYFDSMTVFADHENHSIEIFVNGTGNEIISYTITDAAGKIILQETRQLNNGTSIITIGTKKLANGVYFIRSADQEGNMRTWKILL